MATCEAGGVSISCSGGCGIICTTEGKRKCVAMCNPEVSIFKFGGEFLLEDEVTLCAHDLLPESFTLLFQHALPTHTVRASVVDVQSSATTLKKEIQHVGQVAEIADRLGLKITPKEHRI